jgi:hypothetical protein
MRRALAIVLAFTWLACGTPTPQIAPDAGTIDDDAGSSLDSGTPDAGTPDAGQPDAGQPDSGVPDSGVADAGMQPPHWGWAKSTINTGAHSAIVTANGASRIPTAGFTTVSGLTYDFIFDPSAIYEITNPAQPDDQLDWNKLPGLSDCGQLDLAQDGLMFAWRWRLDLHPRVLELAHYANNGGTHLYPANGILTLDEDDLRAETPLRYELSITSTEYHFHVSGLIRGRMIDVTATHPRRCTSSTTAFKWAGGFYFGGTSTAPHTITGWAQ